jgi:hypothetical protein
MHESSDLSGGLLNLFEAIQNSASQLARGAGTLGAQKASSRIVISQQIGKRTADIHRNG